MVIDGRDRIILTSNLRSNTGRFSFNYDGTTVVRFDVDGGFDTNFDDEGIQLLGNSSLVTFPTSKQVAIDSQGNLLMSLGATGLNSDPETGIFKLARLRFE